MATPSLLLLFDLDETLLAGTGKVPRNTWYALQWHHEHGTTLGIVTNNMLGYSLAASLALTRYIPLENILIQRHRAEDRGAMVSRWLHGRPAFTKLVFFDDRLDNIASVEARRFPNLLCVHVSSPMALPALIKQHSAPEPELCACTDLPLDMFITEIALTLSVFDLLALAVTCRSFCTALRSQAFWKKRWATNEDTYDIDIRWLSSRFRIEYVHVLHVARNIHPSKRKEGRGDQRIGKIQPILQSGERVKWHRLAEVLGLYHYTVFQPDHVPAHVTVVTGPKKPCAFDDCDDEGWQAVCELRAERARGIYITARPHYLPHGVIVAENQDDVIQVPPRMMRSDELKAERRRLRALVDDKVKAARLVDANAPGGGGKN